MPYQIAGIDVHKKMVAVAVADVEVEGEYQFDHWKIGTRPAQLRALAEWLLERDVEEVVMESTRHVEIRCTEIRRYLSYMDEPGSKIFPVKLA